ncbi:MAG TPA: glycosyltransferase [Noviherbaspirillum sp.]
MTKIIAFDKERRNRREANRETKARARLHLGSKPVTSAPTAAIQPAALHRKPGVATDMAVSVVVPTRGRAHLLNRCLASLVLQRFDTHRFEIIVVDDGPDDATREVVANWTAHCAQSGPDITYIPSMGPHGPAAARNHGWRAARAPIVAFTDDDTVPRGDWLRNGLRAFGEGVDAVSGRVAMPLTGTPTDYQLDAKKREQVEFLTANCFCRLQVLEDLGGFDERFRFRWREDTDLYFRLLEYRARIVHEPRAVVMHPPRHAPWGISLAQVRRMQSEALLYKKHPTLYRRCVRAHARWDFYLTVAALLGALCCALAGAVLPALLSGALWLACTARFCVQRLRRTSKSPLHVLEMIVTSILLPPLAVFWRAVGALRFRVALG